METYKYMAMIKPEKLGNLSLFSKKEYIPTAYFASRNPLNKDANQKKGSVASGTSLLQGKVSYRLSSQLNFTGEGCICPEEHGLTEDTSTSIQKLPS